VSMTAVLREGTGDLLQGADSPSISRGPIFVGGLDRCGKTTMCAFLTSHPNIAIPAVGSNMWTYFYGQFGNLGKSQNLERCLRAMLRYTHIRILDPDPERIRREFLQGPSSYARLFSLFLIHYAERQGKPRWGAQTGLIERYADHLFDAHPGVKVIHMVRDPRDRYEASLALWPDGKGRAGGATARWRYSIHLAERNLRMYLGDYLIVRYEDMVLHTEETIRGVCGFLQEKFQPEMLSMSGALERRRKLMTGSQLKSIHAPLSSEFIGRFRTRVSEPEIAFIQLHAGGMMRAYGYSLDPLNLSLQEWARFVLLDWPNQLARMGAWQAVESMQQRFPAYVGRKPDPKRIVAPPIGYSR
jgi:hypothetical protein